MHFTFVLAHMSRWLPGECCKRAARILDAFIAVAVPSGKLVWQASPTQGFTPLQHDQPERDVDIVDRAVCVDQLFAAFAWMRSAGWRYDSFIESLAYDIILQTGLQYAWHSNAN